MAFAKRRFPLTVGAEAAARSMAVGDGVTGFAPGDRVVPYRRAGLRHLPSLPRRDARTCARTSPACAASISTASPQELTNHPARLAVRIPDGVDDCAMPPASPVAYATVEHMLFDNAQLEPGEIILVHAGGSGIGSIAIRDRQGDRLHRHHHRRQRRTRRRRRARLAPTM